jgi:hypothetical protein
MSSLLLQVPEIRDCVSRTTIRLIVEFDERGVEQGRTDVGSRIKSGMTVSAQDSAAKRSLKKTIFLQRGKSHMPSHVRCGCRRFGWTIPRRAPHGTRAREATGAGVPAHEAERSQRQTTTTRAAPSHRKLEQ